MTGFVECRICALLFSIIILIRKKRREILNGGSQRCVSQRRNQKGKRPQRHEPANKSVTYLLRHTWPLFVFPYVSVCHCRSKEWNGALFVFGEFFFRNFFQNFFFRIFFQNFIFRIFFQKFFRISFRNFFFGIFLKIFFSQFFWGEF